MVSTDFFRKLAQVERDVAADHGEFTLFALFQPEEGLEQWDLVVAAPWLDKFKGLELLNRRVYATLSGEGMKRIARVVVLNADDPALARIRAAVGQHQSGAVEEISNPRDLKLDVERAIVITSTSTEG